MAAGLAAIIAAGKAQAIQGTILQLSSIFTSMYTAQLTNMASQQKTIMDAQTGIGQAYASGAAGLYGAAYAANNEMGNVFRKAGGH